jgi:hypothetical protein
MICGNFVRVFRGLAAARNIHIWLEFRYRKADNRSNKTRQGYARERILKPAGSSFLEGVL